MKKLMIANRGEIAIRIVRAARDYGVASVAVYADADAGSLHVKAADEAYGLGPGSAAETYLNIDAVLAVARRVGADAVHPGYGFLSERPEFAEAVLAAGLIWVGPSPSAIRALGDKIEARRIAARVGAPLVRGTDGPVTSATEAVDFARHVGLPVAIKAAFGGGGRGLKVARRIEDVGPLFESATREAVAAFGRGECFVEQFLDRPRHVETQILADGYGTIHVLGTRDCTLQRRNQKLVEEAPAPFLTDEQRHRIEEASHAICAEVGYEGAGTVEFLLSRDGVISFLEVNTRLQVEHTVTESVTGIDIVVEQLRIADGLPLSFPCKPELRGHAIEFRINAEDPGRGFLPTPGRIAEFSPPSGPGIRLDTGVGSGSVIPPLYDSLMAKLVVTGTTRDEALARARRALHEFKVTGVASVLPFHRAIVNDPTFLGTDGFSVHTGYIEERYASMPPAPRVDPVDASLVRGSIEIDGKRHMVAFPAEWLALAAAVQPVDVTLDPLAAQSGDAVYATMAGTLQAWLVSDGAFVRAGEAVATLEAMKMETRLSAPCDGRIRHVVTAGSSVSSGTRLAHFDCNEKEGLSQ